MNVALAAVALAPALALGSFLNVVVARVPEGRSLLRPRSACPECGHALAWHDNVPIVSYLALRARCRRCGAGIAARYVVVEIATALLVAGCFLRFGLSGRAFVGAAFCAVLVALSAIDFERRILPDRIVLPAAAAVLGAQIALYPAQALEWVLGAFGASLFLLLAVVAYPKGMGLGDVKLALLLGAALGKQVAVGLMLGMLAAMLASGVLFARHGLAARKMYIPFGPFLAVGSILAFFWGEAILDAYLSLFFR